MNTVFLLTGVLLVGEALALFVRFHWLGPRDAPRITPRNTTLLILDTITGLVLIWAVFAGTTGSVWFVAAVLIGLLTHGLRAREHRAGQPTPFCASRLLVALNTLKLILLLILVGWLVRGWLGGGV